MDFTNGEIFSQWLRLIASAFNSGLLIADWYRPRLADASIRAKAMSRSFILKISPLAKSI